MPRPTQRSAASARYWCLSDDGPGIEHVSHDDGDDGDPVVSDDENNGL